MSTSVQAVQEAVHVVQAVQEAVQDAQAVQKVVQGGAAVDSGVVEYTPFKVLTLRLYTLN